MGEAVFPAPGLEEAPVEGGKEPRFHLAGVAQLFPFGSPGVKGMLREVAGIGLRTREAEGELIQGPVVLFDDILKFQTVRVVSLKINRLDLHPFVLLSARSP